MEYTVYLTLFCAIFAYVCVSDSNVIEWINIKLQHLLVVLQLRYIKLKWMFKKF